MRAGATGGRDGRGPGAYRYDDFLMAGFVAVLLTTNLVSVGKRVELGGFVFGAGVLFFPLSYLFGDVLTEVYGYARSRRVVWAGFAAMAFAAAVARIVLALPSDPTWASQGAFEAVFGNTWRVVAASMAGFFAGEFANAMTMSKMKIWTGGRRLWTRTIGSTVVGEAVDSALFYPIAFLGVWPPDRLLAVTLANYLLKVAWEVVATPITYAVVAFLKRAEGEDRYDYGVDYSPFSLRA